MIQAKEFLHRRQRLLDQMLPNSMCLVPAAHLCTRSNDTEYPFRQDSDFWYLTGFHEHDAVLLLTNSEREEVQSILFCLAKDPLAEIWQGRRVGPEKAVADFDMDEAHVLEDLGEGLVELLDGHDHLYFAQGHDAQTDDLVFQTLETLRQAPKQTKTAPTNIIDVRPLLHEMRLFKSPGEAEVMRRAGQISATAHTRAMLAASKAQFEYQLEAEIHHEFARQGARSPAYASIVGAGENACILHYTENNAALNQQDLVLIDAGCELQGYAADITRTFPLSGKFSEPQRQLYDLVLKAQYQAFSLLKPGSTLKLATDKAIEVITEGLIELGLLQGELAENIEKLTYRAFFMHGLGHWLGLDVHDVGDYKVAGEDRPLQPGMVLTVEPGIYVAPDADVDPKWRGIGIRIEDNIMITETGHENLTLGVPKEADEIEALMAQAEQR